MKMIKKTTPFLNFVVLVVLSIISFGFAHPDYVDLLTYSTDGDQLPVASESSVNGSIATLSETVNATHRRRLQKRDVKITPVWRPMNKTVLESITSPNNQQLAPVQRILSKYEGNFQLSPELQLYWKSTTLNVDFAMVLKLSEADIESLYFPWIGLGFGRAMGNSEFVIAHLNLTTDPITFDLHEHQTLLKYAPPGKNIPRNQWVINERVVGFFIDNTFIVEFRKPIAPNDDLHQSISLTDQDMIWAWSNVNNVLRGGTNFEYHTELRRGAFKAQFSQNQASTQPVVSFKGKQAHGFGMMFVWMFVFPFGFYYSRYQRSNHGWMVVHITTQSFGLAGVWIFLIVILSTYIEGIPSAHIVLGALLIFFITLQALGGVLNRLSLKYESFSPYNKIIRTVHDFSGPILILLGVVQCGLGLEKLYPWNEPRGKVAWGIYIALIVFWSVLFIGTEIVFKRVVVQKASSNSKVTKPVSLPTVKKDDSNKTLLPKNQGLAMEKRTTTMMEVAKKKAEENSAGQALQTFTWKSLNESIVDGKLYVVANRKYVYDISKWIRSHPGGQIILFGVAGTDITNDYFHEAGFDAEEFLPKLKAPKKSTGAFKKPFATDNASVNDANSTASGVLLKRVPDMQARLEMEAANDNLARQIEKLSFLTDEDKSKIMKARRPHVHTKHAIERLSSLLAGEIVNEPSTINEEADSPRNSISVLKDAQPMEFRRYAMTAKEVASQPEAKYQVFKLRFCLLYPHDLRGVEPGEPIADSPDLVPFLPGQAIELQCRIQGKYVSRYYTPIGGNMMAFEILVKVKRDGLMTLFLEKQKPGERQFKIRGPFGKPYVHPERHLPYSSTNYLLCNPEAEPQWMPDRVYFISGGSGVTPFLHMLQSWFLSTGEMMYVRQSYIPQAADEIQVSPGDIVVPLHQYMDGWCFGVNWTTKREGLFPLVIVQPSLSFGTKLTLINCSVRGCSELFGGDIIQGAMLGYESEYLEVHQVVASPEGMENPGIIGNIHVGMLNQELLEKIIQHSEHDIRRPLDSDENNESDAQSLIRKFYICGSDSFNGNVTDLLTENLGYSHDELVLLGSSTPHGLKDGSMGTQRN